MARLILEISQRGRAQPALIPVARLPFRIGRGYDNDLILTDDTISAHHLVITEDETGVLCVINRSTENGSWLNGKALGERAVVAPAGSHLSIGHTELTFIDPSLAVPPARPVTASRHKLAGKLPVALGLLAIFVAVMVWQALAIRVNGESWSQIFMGSLAEITSPVAFALLTAFISRVLLHRWQYPLQLTIAVLFSLSSIFIGEVSGAVEYYYSSSYNSMWFERISSVLLFATLASWQLHAISTLSSKWASVIGSALVIAGLSFGWISAWVEDPDFSSQPPMSNVLQHPDWRKAPTLPLDEFLTTVRDDLADGDTNQPPSGSP